MELITEDLPEGTREAAELEPGEDRSAGRPRPAPGGIVLRGVAGVLPVALLVGVWLLLAYSSGGLTPRQWMPGALAVALAGAAALVMCINPRRPRRLSLGVLSLLFLYSLWLLASAGWALSLDRALEEAGRTFFYLVFFGLALTYLTAGNGRRLLRYLLLGAALLFVLVAIWRLQSTSELPSLFAEDRFSYPIRHASSSAALYLLLFWPLLWLAAGSGERAPVRGLAVGLCAALLQLAVLTQSRGAIWALGITALLTFLLSPARLRTFFYLLVPLVLLLYSFPHLNRYWVQGVATVPGDNAAWDVLLSLVVGSFAGLVVALLEAWVMVTRRMKLVFGGIVLVLLAGGLFLGYQGLQEQVDDPLEWLSEARRAFIAGEPVSLPGFEGRKNSRLVDAGGDDRWDGWRVAWMDFKEQPWRGLGAGSFVFTYDKLRSGDDAPRLPSLELRVLAETGVPGMLLLFGGLALAAGGVLWARFSAGLRALFARPPGPWGHDPTAFGWPVALLMGLAFWLVHATAEGLWQVPGVTVGALLLLALALSEIDAYHEPWARLGARLSRLGMRLHLSRETSGSGVADRSAAAGEPAAASEGFSSFRRSDRHEGRRRRRLRREDRQARVDRRLDPPGLLSQVFRWVGVMLCLVLAIALGFAYVSAQYGQAALAEIRTDPGKAAELAHTAARLRPTDPDPLQVEAEAYRFKAQATATRSESGPAESAVDPLVSLESISTDLARALSAHERALERDDAFWLTHYEAALLALDLAALQEPAQAAGERAEAWASLVPRLDPGEQRESTSAAGDADPAAAPDSEAHSPARYLGMSAADLLVLARAHLEQARERMPLRPEVNNLIGLSPVQEGASPGR